MRETTGAGSQVVWVQVVQSRSAERHVAPRGPRDRDGTPLARPTGAQSACSRLMQLRVQQLAFSRSAGQHDRTIGRRSGWQASSAFSTHHAVRSTEYAPFSAQHQGRTIQYAAFSCIHFAAFSH